MPEKRGLDRTDADERQPDAKRPKVPALASVIVEALKVDSLQKFCSSLEPILRRIVSEELERALAKLAPSSLGGRSSPKRIEGPDGRNLQLHFRSRLSLPLFTGGKVEGEQGVAIHVLLLDATTGHVVQSGPESSAKLDIVVLEGDFDDEDDDGWSEEDFESHVVKAREGKRPLLTGDLQVSLKEGVGTLGELVFTDNSSWIRSRKFRLGLKVASGFCEGTRIREAKTEAFTVKDHRGELYKKHYPPALKDEVWRLEKIGKDGSFHKRLNKAEIYKVEDFLRLVVRDPQKLRNILGSGMSNKMWESLVEHAKTCVLSGTHYVYYLDDMKNVGAVFSNICEFIGLISGGQYCSAECLTDHQKVFADTLVKKAYDNWTCVTEYDGESLLNFKKNKKLLPSQIEPPSVTANYPASCDQDAPQHHLCEQPSTATRTMIGADTVPVYATSNHLNRYPTHAYDVQYQFPQNSNQAQITGNMHTGLSLGPPQQASLDFQPMCESLQPMNLAGYDDWSHQRDYMGVDDILSEEDIRMRSSEMLESEDMQHLLRGFSMGGGASTSFPEDGYNYPPYMVTPATPTQSSSSEGSRNHSRSSGKAVVGWLKIKAAMRWGIFVRKKAAQRRARLVELED